MGQSDGPEPTGGPPAPAQPDDRRESGASAGPAAPQTPPQAPATPNFTLPTSPGAPSAPPASAPNTPGVVPPMGAPAWQAGPVYPPPGYPAPGYPPTPGYPEGYPPNPQYPYNPNYPGYPNYPTPNAPAPGGYPGNPGYPYPSYPPAYPAPNAPYPAPIPTATPNGTGGSGAPDYGKAYQPFQPPKPPRAPRRRGRRVGAVAGAALALLTVISVLGLVIYAAVGSTGVRIGPFILGRQEQISGVVYGINFASSEQGTFIGQRISAQVNCSGVTTQTNADGSYSLAVPSSDEYSCLVSALPTYAPLRVTIIGQGIHPLTVNFGSRGPQSTSSAKAPSCATADKGTLVTCAAIPLTPATAHGVVTNAATGQPIPNVSVDCWNDDAALAASDDVARMYSATTNATGAYSLSLPPDHYACVGDNTGALHRFTATLGQDVPLNMAVCVSNCFGMSYHQGQVLHTQAIYLDFWLPSGATYEPGGSDTRFESLVKRYFNDVSGTSFYGLLTQYWDESGPVRNREQLAGVYFDTTPYPHAGTQADPLTDQDIQESILRATFAHPSWGQVSGRDEFVVATGYGMNECAQEGCSFARNGNDANAFCAYHSTLGNGNVYAYAPDVPDCNYQPSFDSGRIPENDAIAAANINHLSHEQFESITDPNGDAWFTDRANDGEIGDLCYTSFGPVNSQGGTVTLAHGDTYALQEEWSNLLGACAYK